MATLQRDLEKTQRQSAHEAERIVEETGFRRTEI
jgi:hypothetical protein